MAQTDIKYVGLAPILKFETQYDGTLRVVGKATDETLDSDDQIVDLQWASKALSDWLETGGNLRVQHNPSLYPAGVGIELEIRPDGAYVTSEVVEPIAKRLVEKGVLTAYSVGISHPKVVKDSRAPGGRICGGSIVELSLVDRPANSACKISLAKGVGSGEWVGEIEEIDAEMEKEITADLTKSAEEAETVAAVEEVAEKSEESELDKLTNAIEVIKGSRVFYTNDHKDNVSKAMAELHDSLAKAFPEVCSSMDKVEAEAEVSKAVDDEEDEDKKPSDSEDEADSDAADEAADNEEDDEEDDEDKEKSVEPEAVKAAEVEVSDDVDEVSLKTVLVELKKLKKQNKKLQAQYDELASEPDPAQAAMRGVMTAPMFQKVATPADEAQKRAAERERTEQVAWLRVVATGGEPVKASWAQKRLADLGEDYA